MSKWPMSDEERARREAAREPLKIEWHPIEPLSPERQKLFDELDKALQANLLMSAPEATKLSEGPALVAEPLQATMIRVIFEEKRLNLRRE